MTRNERIRWVARHLCSVGIRCSDLPGGRAIEPTEVSLMLYELADLREQIARQPVEERSLITRMLDRFAR